MKLWITLLMQSGSIKYFLMKLLCNTIFTRYKYINSITLQTASIKTIQLSVVFSDKRYNLPWYFIEKEIWLAFKRILARIISWSASKVQPDLVTSGQNDLGWFQHWNIMIAIWIHYCYNKCTILWTPFPKMSITLESDYRMIWAYNVFES